MPGTDHVTTEQLPPVDLSDVSPEMQQLLSGDGDGAGGSSTSREDVDGFLDMVGEFTFGGDRAQIDSYKTMARPLLLWLGFDGVLIPITTMSPRVRLFGTLGVLVMAAVVVKVRHANETKSTDKGESTNERQHQRPKQPAEAASQS